MIEFVCKIVIVATMASFLLALAYKWKVIEWLQVHNGDHGIIDQMVRCSFCLSWWTGVLVSIVAFLVTKDASFCLVPFFSTTITRMLI